MKKIIVIFSALLISMNIFAQDAKFGPYETNSFFSNWFVEAGAGVNVPFDAGFTFDFGGLAVYGNVGKWIDPRYGVRVGWHGLTTGNLDEPVSFRDSFVDGPYLNYVHGDFLLNFSNLVAGYRSDRFADVVPYLTVGALFNSTSRGLGVGAGVQVPLRISKRVHVVPQVQGVVTNNRIYGGSGVTALASATVGVTVSLGKVGWRRSHEAYAEYESKISVLEAENLALANRNKELTSKNSELYGSNQSLKADVNELNSLLKQARDNSGEINCEGKFVAYFKLGQSKLSTKDQAYLAQFVNDYLGKNDGCTVTFYVGGATDSKTGTARRNEQLRKQRAEHVVSLLRDKYGVENVEVVEGFVDIDIPELSRAAVVTVK